MRPDLPPYVTRSDRGQRQRRARRRRLVLAVIVIIVAAVVVVLAFTLLGGTKSTATTTTTLRLAPSTSTSVGQTTSSSTTSTSLSGPTSSTSTSLSNAALVYSAALSGQDEIPAVVTSASGTLTLTVAADSKSVHYAFKVSNLADLTLARLHEGKAGATGVTILTIYGGPTRTDVFSGVITQGSFTADQLGGPLKGKTMADFMALVKGGSVYFNVGTTTHPTGEIRGQLK